MSIDESEQGSQLLTTPPRIRASGIPASGSGDDAAEGEDLIEYAMLVALMALVVVPLPSGNSERQRNDWLLDSNAGSQHPTKD